MNYIIFDLEWNQAFSDRKRIRKPIYLTGEIIQIGAVKVGENGEYIDNFKIGVKPQYYTLMNNKVKKLTGITNEDLEYGFDFPVAYHHFRTWCGEDVIFFSWGNDDKGILNQNMKLHELGDFHDKVYNLQKIFDMQIGHQNRQMSLEDAVAMIGGNKRRTHDANSDALSTYDVFCHLDITDGIANYSRNYSKNESIFSNVEYMDAEYIGVETYVFPEGTHYLYSDEFASFTCPGCGQSHACGEWVRQNGSKFLSLGECTNGQQYVLRTKKRRYGNMTQVRKMIYNYEQLGGYYEERVERAKEKAERAKEYEELQMAN